MKFMIIAGIPRTEGNTMKLLDEFTKQLVDSGHTFEVFHYPTNQPSVKGCSNCRICTSLNRCVLRDDFSSFMVDNLDADAVIVFSPIFFFGFSSQAKTLIDRLYSFPLTGKVFTAITSSGSDNYFGGADIVRDTLRRTRDYCGSLYAEGCAYNKVTHDDIWSIFDEDTISIFQVIQKCEELNRSFKDSMQRAELE